MTLRLCVVLLLSSCSLAQQVALPAVPAAAGGESTDSKTPGKFIRVPGFDGEVYVGSDIEGPKPLYTPDTKLPELARGLELHTYTELQYVIGFDGLPQAITIKRPAGPMFDEASLETLKTWRFAPAIRQGVTVPVQQTVEFSFSVFPACSPYDQQLINRTNVRWLDDAIKSADMLALSKQAEQGDRRARLLVGYSYWAAQKRWPRLPSPTGEPDIPQSIAWLKKAAEQGSATAAYVLGFIDQTGQDQGISYSQSYKWWMIAKTAGMPISVHLLDGIRKRLGKAELKAVQEETKQWLKSHPMEIEEPTRHTIQQLGCACLP